MEALQDARTGIQKLRRRVEGKDSATHECNCSDNFANSRPLEETDSRKLSVE